MTREVLMAGEVVEVNYGRFWVSFTTKTDNGGRVYTTTLRLGLTKLRLGRRVEWVRVKHSLLWGKIQWTDESIRFVK